MKKLRVICNECANELKIDNKVKFVTCSGCETILSVVKTNNSFYTQKHKTSSEAYFVSKEMKEALNIYIEIKITEREWAKERATYTKDGKPPKYTGYGCLALIVGGLAGIWGMLAAFDSLEHGAIGAGIFILGITLFIFSFEKEDEYTKAEQTFFRKKNALVKKYKNLDEKALRQLREIIGDI